MEINIYIELDSMSPKTTEGYYGYVLEWKTKTREGFGKTEGSPAKRLLVALTEALDRIRVDCAVNIFCGNRWAAHALNDDLEHWKENGWKNVRGTEIKHKELWERVEKHTETMDIMAFYAENHPYKEWLRREMEEITDREREIYEYITQFENQHGRTPTLEEITSGIYLGSGAAVQYHLRQLERKGILKEWKGTGGELRT